MTEMCKGQFLIWRGFVKSSFLIKTFVARRSHRPGKLFQSSLTSDKPAPSKDGSTGASRSLGISNSSLRGAISDEITLLLLSRDEIMLANDAGVSTRTTEFLCMGTDGGTDVAASSSSICIWTGASTG